MSPVVGFIPAARKLSRSSDIILTSPATSANSQDRGVIPLSRQTKTVSTMDDPVPWMWMEPPISAGHGSEAEQVNPASRIAMPTAMYASCWLWWYVNTSGAPGLSAWAMRR